jgi:hypothetical protein
MPQLTVILILIFTFLSCQDRDEDVEPALEIAASENVEENPEIEFNYYFDSDTLNLEFQIKNNESKPIFFINNLWKFQYNFTANKQLSDYEKRLRFNQVYIFQDSIASFSEMVVETEMSKYNELNMYKIEKEEPLQIKFKLKLDTKRKELFTKEGFDCTALLVFSDKQWDKYNTEKEIKSKPLIEDTHHNRYSFSSNFERDKYLKKGEVYIVSVEGKWVGE